MSDSGSLGSRSSCSSGSMDLRGPGEEEWAGVRPGPRARDSMSTRSVCSSQEESSDTPTRETIGAALDKYMASSREGRQAFSTGKLNEAVTEFDQALDIELQTELECLYDTSIGLVSGLVRREVEERLGRQNRHGSSEADAKCSKILQELREKYELAAAGVKGKRKDSPQWYLQMGAALVVINEWDKAKAVYSEGLNVCKDRKELKVALKNLIKTEQMTSYANIPEEDQPDKKELVPPASPNKAPSSPARSPSLSPRMAPPSPARSPSHSPRIAKRDRSSSVGLKLKESNRRVRTNSLTMDRDTKATQNLLSVQTTQSPPILKRESLPIMRKEAKRLSFNLFTFRRSSGALQSANRSQEEVEEWSSCFEPGGCVVVGQTDFQPSAITHMRRLTSVEVEEGQEEGEANNLNLTFTPIVQESLRIEDDDSELDDIED